MNYKNTETIKWKQKNNAWTKWNKKGKNCNKEPHKDSWAKESNNWLEKFTIDLIKQKSQWIGTQVIWNYWVRKKKSKGKWRYSKGIIRLHQGTLISVLWESWEENKNKKKEKEERNRCLI